MSKTLLFISDLSVAQGPQPKKGKPTPYSMPIPTDLVTSDFSSKEATCLWAQVKQFVTDPEDQKALAALIKLKFGIKEGGFGNPQWEPAFNFYKKLVEQAAAGKTPIIQNDAQMRQFAGVSWALLLIETAANQLVDWKTIKPEDLYNEIEAALTEILFPEDATETAGNDKAADKTEGELTIQRVDGNVLTKVLENLETSNQGLQKIAEGLVQVIQSNGKIASEAKNMISAPATSNALPDGKKVEEVESFDI